MIDTNILIEEARKIKPGTITRVIYKTELPVKAAFKHEGVSITKLVETSCRLGVDYKNIKSVKERKLQEQESGKEKRAYTNNYEWIIKNKVTYNSNRDKYYLYVANFNKGHNTHSLYRICVDGKTILLDSESFLASEYKHYLIDSYYKKSDSAPEVRTIAFENILRLNSVTD